MDIIRLFADGFPLTIGRLEFLQQTYTKAISQLTTIYGLRDNEVGILTGVQTSGSDLTSGVVVFNGEIIEFRGGLVGDNFVLAEDIVEVPYNIDADNDGNLDQKASDVVRYITTELLATNGFKDISVDYDLKRLPNIQQLSPAVGEVKMWKGAAEDVPAGWQIMEEMNDRFPIGISLNNGSYNVGQEVGANNVTLGLSQMPIHSHSGVTTTNGAHTHSVPNEVGGGGSGVHFKIESFNRDRQQGSSAGSHSHTLSIQTSGGDQPHENRPASIAMYFIEFVGF